MPIAPDRILKELISFGVCHISLESTLRKKSGHKKRLAQGRKSEASSTPRKFSSTRGIQGSTEGVRREYEGSTREYQGVRGEYNGSTRGVQWKYEGRIILKFHS
jgi:hypothetical protein